MTWKTKPADLLWNLAAFALSAVLAWTAFQVHMSAGQATMVFPRSTMSITRADGSRANFNIEIAVTPEQQETGLMFRKNLQRDAGMIFLWQKDQVVTMWMKNTLIPLDMLFVADSGRIEKIIANAVPNDLTALSSDIPVKAVIEIGGGQAQTQNIKAGDIVVYPAFTK